MRTHVRIHVGTRMRTQSVRTHNTHSTDSVRALCTYAQYT